MNKIDGFSKLHNIQFEQKGIRVWRSYGIGRGKEIPFDQLVSQGQETTGLVITSTFFALKDTRVYKCKEPLAESSDDDHDSELDIFECSEPGCVKSFQHFRSSNRIWTLETLETKSNHNLVLEDEEFEKQRLIAEVANELRPQHPLSYDAFNLCESARKNQLNQFNVAMLKQILCHLEIPFKYRDRKKDLIEQLMSFIEECTCFSS